MKTNTKVTHITPAGANVFADLGFAPAEAAALKAESQRIINNKKKNKELLMNQISEWVTVSNLKQAEAAVILSVSRPRVSDVMNKKTEKFTVDTLIDMVARTGKEVSVTVI